MSHISTDITLRINVICMFCIIDIQNMISEQPMRTTIIVDPSTRDILKHIARKDQSYDALIMELLKSRPDYVEIVQSLASGVADTPTQ